MKTKTADFLLIFLGSSAFLIIAQMLVPKILAKIEHWRFGRENYVVYTKDTFTNPSSIFYHNYSSLVPKSGKGSTIC